MNYKWIMKKLKVLLLSLSQIIIKPEYLVFLDTKHNDQLSFGQIPMEISKGNPQLSDLQTKGNRANHEELDLQRSSISKEEQ